MRRQKRTGKGAICAAIVFGLVSAIFFAAALVPKECAHDENRGEKSERNIYGTSIEAWFELVAGSSTVITHTPASWHIRLTIKPIGEGNVTNITAKIAFGAEFHITSVYASSGSVEKTSSGNGQMNSTKVTWRIDSLIDDESLDIILSTSLNPAGKQEFTSAGNYRLGSATIEINGDSIEVNGPIVKAIDCGNDDDDDCPCNAQPEFTYSVNYTKSIYIEGVDGLQNLPLNTSFISDEQRNDLSLDLGRNATLYIHNATEGCIYTIPFVVLRWIGDFPLSVKWQIDDNSDLTAVRYFALNISSKGLISIVKNCVVVNESVQFTIQPKSHVYINISFLIDTENSKTAYIAFTESFRILHPGPPIPPSPSSQIPTFNSSRYNVKSCSMNFSNAFENAAENITFIILNSSSENSYEGGRNASISGNNIPFGTLFEADFVKICLSPNTSVPFLVKWSIDLINTSIVGLLEFFLIFNWTEYPIVWNGSFLLYEVQHVIAPGSSIPVKIRLVGAETASQAKIVFRESWTMLYD